MKVLVIDDVSGIVRQICAGLNAAELPEGCERVALNFELPGDGSVPEWIELIPAGQVVQGRDGRTWINDRPADLLAVFAADGRDIPLDWEHATELKAPQGEPAPAAAWIKQLEVRDEGAVWGRIEWTEKGRASVAVKEYRYISPVFVFEVESRRIRQITSAGLTNRPNLQLQALNREQPTKGAPPMKKLLALLGLPETATEDQALNALGALKTDLATALNRAETPSLDKFVPRADYDTVVARATNAEQQLADQKKTELETAINAEIDAALIAGKITPATKDYHVATCREAGGLDRFKAFVAAAPVVAAASGLDGKKPEDQAAALNAEEQKVCDALGISVEEYRKTAV